ncbi:hypothetical protein SBV1_300046 [Verrucomicrobia bacterium]|nr:hypothetical protein SBV1_300046 [Verrucomicrobiota bacterium]
MALPQHVTRDDREGGRGGRRGFEEVSARGRCLVHEMIFRCDVESICGEFMPALAQVKLRLWGGAAGIECFCRDQTTEDAEYPEVSSPLVHALNGQLTRSPGRATR